MEKERRKTLEFKRKSRKFTDSLRAMTPYVPSDSEKDKDKSKTSHHLYLDPSSKRWKPILPPPSEVKFWLEGEEVKTWGRKSQIEAAFPWLEQALLNAYGHEDIKLAVMRLLGHYHFTPFLKEYGLLCRLQQHCKAAALRIGARLDEYYKSTNLSEMLGKLELPIREEFKNTKTCRQDMNPPIKLPIPLHVHALNSSSFNFMRKFAAGDEDEVWEWAEQESIFIHMLRLTALAIDSMYQYKVKAIVEKCGGKVKHVPIKGDTRMRNKAWSIFDHRFEKKPRPALNVDINRNCCYFETPRELAEAAKELCKAFGGGTLCVCVCQQFPSLIHIQPTNPNNRCGKIQKYV